MRANCSRWSSSIPANRDGAMRPMPSLGQPSNSSNFSAGGVAWRVPIGDEVDLPEVARVVEVNGLIPIPVPGPPGKTERPSLVVGRENVVPIQATNLVVEALGGGNDHRAIASGDLRHRCGGQNHASPATQILATVPRDGQQSGHREGLVLEAPRRGPRRRRRVDKCPPAPAGRRRVMRRSDTSRPGSCPRLSTCSLPCSTPPPTRTPLPRGSGGRTGDPA